MDAATPPQTNDTQPIVEANDGALQPQVSEWSQKLKSAEGNPHDESAWDALLDFAEESGDLEKIKEAYEALLQKYPNTSSAQISYLNHFLVNQATFPFAEALFARFLRTSVSVDLWKFYIIYVRRLNVGPETRDTVAKAYDFALQHVGQDKDSGDIWAEYIQFVKSGPANSTWEEQQKMDQLRKIYQRAVQIPLENVETLWKDYEAFENGLNKITAKKFLQDLTPAYMTARTKLRELRKHLGILFAPPPGTGSGTRSPLNLPHKPTYNSTERQFVGAWKQYLKWEESNPFEIEERSTLITRVQGVYRKAVVRMRFFSEIWFMAYSWTNSVGRTDEALQILKAGIEANATSFVLNFALAENMELAKNNAEVHATFTKLLQGVLQEIEALDAKITANSNSSSFMEAPPGTASTVEQGTEQTEAAPPLSAGLNKEHSMSVSSASSSEDASLATQLRERKQEYGLVYILYIRFAMRSEGLEASRMVFQKARKDKFTPWEVFEAAAHMEYHVAKQPTVANRILSVAMNRFSQEIDFVVRYLTFLMSVNDENNARALFERTVGTFPPDKARPLWERWARYEYQYGNLEAALKLEKRMAEVYPNDPPIKRFAQRHLYANIDGIANRDLGASRARKEAKDASSLSRSDTIPAITLGVPPPSTGTSQIYNNGGQASFTVKRTMSPERLDRERERDRLRREEVPKPPHKRPRDGSPPLTKDRWGAPSGSRRYGSPAWGDEERGDRGRVVRIDRERDRTRSPARRYDRDEPARPVLPQILNWFVSQLPPPNSFDGPVFRTDDLMQLFRNAVIPGSNTMRERSPPPPPRPTRPPPDYGPYRGPNGRGRF
ncbi:Suf-domain-containing protein [Fomitiporia mediterranea MF3/22]|uniref:Suf-domain-containing protein n=1 Tax=Fomitiporia mediterranea (strain MF3/22) TaxID=694068 RepID=UPI000440932D|nr:Suf-domain-containing protein [Fomitiporia mediterranea MF3/22]EJD00731.1 Suf-domain-containing protein [Fomitiporia mediterranea MF3/22]